MLLFAILDYFTYLFFSEMNVTFLAGARGLVLVELLASVIVKSAGVHVLEGPCWTAPGFLDWFSTLWRIDGPLYLES